jgi:6-phosphofructokinase
MNGIHRIGVMTAGGDCPGLNAVIRAVTKPALAKYNLEVVGIEDGFLGLIQNRMRRLNSESVSNILAVGGTILGTNNKTDPHRFPVDVNGATEFRDVTGQCLENIARNKLDALVVIGGDGSMSIASGLARLGVNCIGVPKTIDNDLWGTDVTFGFATAVSIATDALDRVHTTAASHHRIIVVEVMGRNAGWIALHSGMASGSDVILIPEIPYDFNVVRDVSVLFVCPRGHGPQAEIRSSAVWIPQARTRCASEESAKKSLATLKLRQRLKPGRSLSAIFSAEGLRLRWIASSPRSSATWRLNCLTLEREDG